MKVRRGRPEDIEELRVLGREFYEQTSYHASGVKYSPTTVYNLLVALMGDLGIVCVAEDDDGKIVGFILVAVFPVPFNVKVSGATELAFYVTPEAQKTGIGKQLLNKAEQVAKQRGAKFLSMVSLESVDPEKAQALYTKLGYRKNETLFTKDL
jgi:GNAT superfamily N-acetyltransferase